MIQSMKIHPSDELVEYEAWRVVRDRTRPWLPPVLKKRAVFRRHDLHPEDPGAEYVVTCYVDTADYIASDNVPMLRAILRAAEVSDEARALIPHRFAGQAREGRKGIARWTR